MDCEAVASPIRGETNMSNAPTSHADARYRAQLPQSPTFTANTTTWSPAMKQTYYGNGGK